RHGPLLIGSAVILVVGIVIAITSGGSGSSNQKGGSARSGTQTTTTQSSVMALPSETPSSWASQATQGFSNAPAAVTSAATGFLKSYNRFLAGLGSAGDLQDLTGQLRGELGRSRPAPMSRTPARLVKLKASPSAKGTFTVNALVSLGSAPAGVAITMVQQHGRWLASQVPSAHGSY
ncbi:MAG: hypothetical protein J2P17_27055, partial [Mycobacterium sp.]|nr:hypothetical protein [Mycobacterium sp.]